MTRRLAAAAAASALLLSVGTALADPDGRALFAADCSACHQADGAGIPGVFPKLAGRVGDIATTPAGRTYLLHVLADGMSGQVTVDGLPLAGQMPAFPQLSAAETAAVLTYVSSLGGHAPVPFSADEVAASRTSAMTAEAVHAERARLVSGGVIPH